MIAKDTPPERRALFRADPETRDLFARVLDLPPVPGPTWLRQQVHRSCLASHMQTAVRQPAYHRAVPAPG